MREGRGEDCENHGKEFGLVPEGNAEPGWGLAKSDGIGFVYLRQHSNLITGT
jgi:hypothetical protein